MIDFLLPELCDMNRSGELTGMRQHCRYGQNDLLSPAMTAPVVLSAIALGATIPPGEPGEIDRSRPLAGCRR